MEYNDIDPRDAEAVEAFKTEQHREQMLNLEHVNALYKVLLSPAGEKLVEHWVETYVHTFIAMPHDTNVQIGIKQGQANFVMMVKQTLEQLKKGVENG